MILVDSSAWVDYLRSGTSDVSGEVDRLLEAGRVAVCGMVEMEILQGLRPEHHARISELLGALPYLETERKDFAEAGRRGASLRRRGITIPGADCLIGVIALKYDLPLLTLDRHFDHLDDVRRHEVETG